MADDDPIATYLKSAPISQERRADLWDAYYKAQTSDDLTAAIKSMPVPAFVKAKLYDLKTGQGGTSPAIQDPSYKSEMSPVSRADLELHGVNPAERAQPHMGPISPSDAGPFTLAELIDNPKLSLRRMAAAFKADLLNPRVSIPVAIGAASGLLRATGVGTGSVPSAAAEVAPEATPAPRTGIGSAIRQNVSLDDVVEAIPGARNLKAGYRVVQGVRRAMQQTTPSAPGPAPSEVPPTSAPTVPETPKPVAEAATPAATVARPSSLEDLHLTPSEITEAVKWHEAGVSPEKIVDRILASRQLTAQTKTTTPDQARIAIEYRNAHGRWQDEK